ncbi:hypothetical protein D3C79_660880 [compost metagenome]
MHQQDVLLADHAEDVVGVHQQLGDRRGERRVLQLRVAVQAGDAEQAGEVDRAIDLVQLAFAEAELLQQVVRQMFRTGVGHLQAHGVTVAAREQLAAQGAGQVVDLFGVQRQVGVTGQAELVAALDLHALEQVVGVRVDHRRQEHVVCARAAHLFRHANNPRQQAWCRNDRQTRVATEGVHPLELDYEVEALVHQQRERVSRVEANRGNDRGNFVAEVAAYPGLELGCPVAAADEADLVLFQLRQQHVVEDRVLALYLGVHQFADTRQRLVRLQAIGAGLFTGEVDLLLQAGDANLKELVEVAGEDQQELEAFQQRVVLVQCLLQHPDIELQLREFAMNVQAAVVQARDGDGRRRRGHRSHRLDHLFRYRLGHRRQVWRGLQHLFWKLLSILDRDRA